MASTITTTKISVEVSVSAVNAKVVRHLAVIGKRAKDTSGKSLFSDITITEQEKIILDDLISSGAETIVNQLAPFCGYYDNTATKTISFVITAKRWTDTDATTELENDKDLTKALEEAIQNYLYNYTLAQYLSIIHPSTGEKYPPLYGTTYTNHCALIIQNIIGLCNLNRNPKASTKTYADVKALNDTATLTITAVDSLTKRVLSASVYINNTYCSTGQATVNTAEKSSYVITADGYTMKLGEVFITEDTALSVPMIQSPS